MPVSSEPVETMSVVLDFDLVSDFLNSEEVVPQNVLLSVLLEKDVLIRLLIDHSNEEVPALS